MPSALPKRSPEKARAFPGGRENLNFNWVVDTILNLARVIIITPITELQNASFPNNFNNSIAAQNRRGTFLRLCNVGPLSRLLGCPVKRVGTVSTTRLREHPGANALGLLTHRRPARYSLDRKNRRRLFGGRGEGYHKVLSPHQRWKAGTRAARAATSPRSSKPASGNADCSR